VSPMWTIVSVKHISLDCNEILSLNTNLICNKLLDYCEELMSKFLCSSENRSRNSIITFFNLSN
jgi:hypothetical protein